MDIKDKVWTEKYRPKKVSLMVGSFKNQILKYLENPNTVPHFLFHSRAPGTGKTTLAKSIINELGCDALLLNSSDDRKIEVVRDKVKEFAMTQSSKQGKRRCVFMDEFDGMLKASQDALRNLMETYSSNVFFILTCNNVNKVIEPIKSRCQVIPFAYPEKNEIEAYLNNICDKEGMEHTDEGIKEVIEKNYPSIRNCVSCLQDLYTQGLPVTKENVKPVNEIFDTLWALFKEKNWVEIKKTVLASTIDPRELNTFFWNRSLEESPIDLKLIQITCRNERDISGGADPKVIFVTSIIEMCR